MLDPMARVLLTGADGYIGVRLGDHLLRAGFDVVGLDSGFHRVGWLYRSAELRHVHRYTRGQLRRAARPEFEPDTRPAPDCGKASFGPRSAFRLVALRRT